MTDRFSVVTRISLTSAAAFSLAFALGCPKGSEYTELSGAPPAAHEDEHAHPSTGPHHGDLVELGDEAIHAEVVHGEGGEVTIYMLDSSATNAVPIDAAEVTVNLTHDGEAKQFAIPAVPAEGDPAGKSSRFTMRDQQLTDLLDAEGTTAKLVLTMDGTQYSGKISHSHDHEGHDHAGHEHAAEESQAK